MKNESQNIEYKESWRDEYLKWICGFANAQGGKLYIGINDSGNVCGAKDCKKLLEDIPNKVRDTMGIFVDVNLLTSDQKDYLEIVVNRQSRSRGKRPTTVPGARITMRCRSRRRTSALPIRASTG